MLQVGNAHKVQSFGTPAGGNCLATLASTSMGDYNRRVSEGGMAASWSSNKGRYLSSYGRFHKERKSTDVTLGVFFIDLSLLADVSLTVIPSAVCFQVWWTSCHECTIP
jgi:hypothetical protein